MLTRSALASLWTLAVLASGGCGTDTESSAAEVDRAGTWQASFERIVDVDGPPYEKIEPAPEYPTRVMHAPIADAASCTPGCTCAFVSAVDNCYGDVTQTCTAIGGFTETCSDKHTELDCSNLTFDDDTGTTGVCVLEDLSRSDEFGYQTIQRYQVTLDRLTYD